MDIRPDSAVVLRDGVEEEVFPDEVAVGETIIVKPGERIPLDGIVLEGSSMEDTKALTGEAVPRKVFSKEIFKKANWKSDKSHPYSVKCRPCPKS